MILNPNLAVTVRVTRHSEAVIGRKREKAWVEVTATGAAYALPLAARSKDTILGRISGAAWTLVWGVDDWRNGDRVEFGGRTYTLHEVTQDTTRLYGPYQTGILAEKKA